MDTGTLALWGALISTLLASIRLFEEWKKRFKIEVMCNFNGDPYIGNDLYIANLNSYSIIVKNIKITSDRGLSYINTKEDILEYCLCPPFVIEANNIKRIEFKGEDYFPWGNNKKIYVKIFILGKKKPIVRKIYN